MNYLEKHKEGIFLTLLFHLILLFIVLRYGFFTPLPLPEEKGVLVDFGTSNMGIGKIEPSPKETPAKPIKKEEPIPVPINKTVPSSPVKQPEKVKDVMTQDYEKTAAIDESKRKLEEQKRKEKQLADNRKRDSLQKINDERIAELNRLAEIRRKDSIKKANEQAQINQINSRAKNVFGTSGQGTDNTSTGEGTTYKPGNQGSPDGSPGVKVYGSGGREGISFNLSGRSAVSLPKPSYPGNEEGFVVVEVNVDKYGKVTKAISGVKGSTSLEAGLLEAAQKAALLTRFNQNLDAPAFQTGTITYHFVLN